MAERSSGSGVVFVKEGTLRVRILPVGDDVDWALEMTHFYLGKTVKGVFSAVSIGDECPVHEKYLELKEGSDDDKDLAKSFTPRTKYLIPCLVYEDERGKKIDKDKSGKLVMLTPGIYGEIIDFFVDPDLGDFTDPKEGYDLKIKRTGTTMTNTEYSVTAMRPSPLPKEWNKIVDLEKMAKTVTLPYEDAEDKLADFLAEGPDLDDDDDDDKPPKRSKKRKKKTRGDA